jgi:hypothetical protein
VTEVQFGARVDLTATAGDYTGTVLITVVGNDGESANSGPTFAEAFKSYLDIIAPYESTDMSYTVTDLGKVGMMVYGFAYDPFDDESIYIIENGSGKLAKLNTDSGDVTVVNDMDFGNDKYFEMYNIGDDQIGIYVQGSTGGYFLYTISTGEMKRASDAGGASTHDPDTRRIIYTSSGGVYVMRDDGGGGATRIGDQPTGYTVVSSSAHSPSKFGVVYRFGGATSGSPNSGNGVAVEINAATCGVVRTATVASGGGYAMTYGSAYDEEHIAIAGYYGGTIRAFDEATWTAGAALSSSFSYHAGKPLRLPGGNMLGMRQYSPAVIISGRTSFSFAIEGNGWLQNAYAQLLPTGEIMVAEYTGTVNSGAGLRVHFYKVTPNILVPVPVEILMVMF